MPKLPLLKPTELMKILLRMGFEHQRKQIVFLPKPEILGEAISRIQKII